MTRQRISTTVDGDRLERCRELLGVSDSELVDAALAALLRELLGARERAAIDARPYEDDEHLSWAVPPGPDLPYDGDIPDEVQGLSAQRRAAEGPAGYES